MTPKPTTDKRLRILGDDEIDALYARPRFSEEERVEYFSLSAAEVAALGELHSLKSRVCFILQLGYFKARQQFFSFNLPEVADDVEHIQTQYFPGLQLTDLAITKVTRLKQHRMILALYGYRTCGAKERHLLAAKARQAAIVFAKPIYILREMLHLLTEQRIVLPGYSSLQDVVTHALAEEQTRLTTHLRHQLKPFDIEALQRLLADTEGLYEITQLKREPKNFNAQEIKREIQRGESLCHLYALAQALLPVLTISNESIKYYASLVGYYSVYRLTELNVWMVYLYLLCFATHRYQRLHDHLINALIYNVRRFNDEAKAVAKDRIHDLRVDVNRNLRKAGRVLKLFTDKDIAGDLPFEQVQTRAFRILEREKLAQVAEHIASHIRFDEKAFRWEHIEQIARQFKLHLRPVVQAVSWAAISAHAPLLAALDFLKTTFRKNQPLKQIRAAAFPLGFIPPAQWRYLFVPQDVGSLRPQVDRYEFLAYRQLREGLDAGDIFCRDSVRFRSFEDDLLDDERWQYKDQLLAEAGLARLQQPIQEHLAALKHQLETRLVDVNQRIANGENPHLQINQRGRQTRWNLAYSRSDETINHPFFDTLAQVDIASVLQFVDQHCQFMGAFEHVLGRYAKQASDERIIVASLIAWATNMGLGRMAEVSDLRYHQLARTSENYIRLETLHAANDLVSNATAQLAIFRHYDIGERVHSSSDGQKFETRLDTINARHSPKYFGLKKGVVAYTLVANHIPVNAEIIGANEHESHYVFDILFNNTTDVQPEVHSTDTHGTNQVNFVILHLFGYQFAPRYKDIHDTVKEKLYGFQHPSHYGDVLIKPVRKLDEDLIIEEWDNIQRIMLSLALKTTTQSIIVGKLNAYARKNRTRQALWEYDHIIRSLYLLDYVDSLSLRQNVQKALNRGENYHQLRRAVSYANFGKLRFKTEYEQKIWNECSRLVANCIIYYNASILSNVLAHREKIGDEAGLAMLKKVSPVAWQNVNLQGRFQFHNRPEPIDMDAIIQHLSQSRFGKRG